MKNQTTNQTMNPEALSMSRKAIDQLSSQIVGLKDQLETLAKVNRVLDKENHHLRKQVREQRIQLVDLQKENKELKDGKSSVIVHYHQ